MKLLTTLLVITTMALSNIQLTISETESLKTYNHRPSLKKTVERRMIRMAKLNSQEAEKIAASLCDTNDIRLKLSHKKRYLFYRVEGPSCTLYINALDKSLLNKDMLND